MNIVVDAANIPQMPSGTYYNKGAAYRSHQYCVLQVVYTVWDGNLLN